MLRLAALGILFAGIACAAENTPISAADVSLAPLEQALAGAIGLMMICALASALLVGRVSERTHAALAMVVVLIGGFAMLVLFGGFLYRVPLAAVAGIIVLTGLFKLLNRFEVRSRADGPHKETSGE
jgi:hypothetical protein